MNYSEYRSHGSPIGSGIVGSSRKQIVTERLKLSGIRWSCGADALHHGCGGDLPFLIVWIKDQ